MLPQLFVQPETAVGSAEKEKRHSSMWPAGQFFCEV